MYDKLEKNFLKFDRSVDTDKKEIVFSFFGNGQYPFVVIRLYCSQYYRVLYIILFRLDKWA